MGRKLFIVLFIIVVIAVIVAVFSLSSRDKHDLVNDKVAITPNVTTSSEQNPPRAYEYHVNSPNTFIFVDPQGRRTGKDPITGVVYREIPGVGYGSGQLGFRGLPDGEYTLYVLGGEAGSYWISAYRQGTIDANIQKGAMDVYKIIINSANAKDSGKLIFQGTDSSTASITAESPHNLPLP